MLKQSRYCLSKLPFPPGLHHEQCRPDRDNYVTIVQQNISPPNMKHNLEKMGAYEVDPRGFEYDYHSIMHYGQYFFGQQPWGELKRTIITKDPSMQDVIGKAREVQ